MFSTTAAKLSGSVLLVMTAASGAAHDRQWMPSESSRPESPVVLDRSSLLVATLANGEIQSQWMSTTACERVASAVAAGDAVAGLRSDGVRVYISRANCSTRRVEPAPDTIALSTPEPKH